MNKALQIKLMQKLLKKHGIEPDTVDLEALIDSNLSFTENKKLIFEQLGITEKQRMTKEDEIRETLNQAYEWHQTRSEKAKQIDESRLAKIPENPDQWFKYPHRYDLPGVDAPGSTEDYIRYLKAKGSAKRRILAELKEKEPAQLKKLEKKRKKEQKERLKIEEYNKKHFTLKTVFAYDYQYDHGKSVGVSGSLLRSAELYFFLRGSNLKGKVLKPEILKSEVKDVNLANEALKYALEKDEKLKAIIDQNLVCNKCPYIIKYGEKVCRDCERGIHFCVLEHRTVYIPKEVRIYYKYLWVNPEIISKERAEEQQEMENKVKAFINQEPDKEFVRAVFRFDLDKLDYYIKGKKSLLGMNFILGRYVFFDEIKKYAEEIPDPHPKYYQFVVAVEYRTPKGSGYL